MTTTKRNNKTTNKVMNKSQQLANVEVQAQEVEAVDVENVNETEAETISATITKVMLPEGSDDRITFVLDKTFETIDFTTGEEKETNMFGLNIYAVVNQVGQFVSQIQVADTLAMGKRINPQIIALALTNAEIVVKREQHAQGEQRKNSTEIYARDCITSEIVKVKANIKPIFAEMLTQLVLNMCNNNNKAAAVPNPFGM